MTNSREQIGGNNPPDPIDEALQPYQDSITEAQNWLDGEPVKDEAAMKAVDLLIEDVRGAKTALEKARKSAVAPLYDAYKKENNRFKIKQDDVGLHLTGLAALVGPFKKELAAKQEAARIAAYKEAERTRLEAEQAASEANTANYDQQAEAARAKQDALDAKKAAQELNRGKVKGLRTVTRFEVEDHSAALKWIAQNDRPAVLAFVEEYVRKHHKGQTIDGVCVWKEKEAF